MKFLYVIGYFVVVAMFFYMGFLTRKLVKKQPKLKPNEFLWRMDIPENYEGRCYVYYNKYYCWLIKGVKLHREDGPALEFDDGSKCWYCENQLHRLDGPAVIDNRGNKTYWIHGWKFDEEIYCKHPLVIKTKLNKIVEL